MTDPRVAQDTPREWDRIRARFLFRQRNSKGHPEETPLSASQRFGVVPQSMLEEELDHRVMAAFKGLENFKLVELDDFVISLRSFEGGIEHARYRGIISPAYTVMSHDRRIDPRFFRHVLKERSFISRLNAVTTGIRDGKTIRYEEFAELELPVPPVPAQRAIAAFLDRKTRAIDELIRKKERLIELLQEKRQALAAQAVTKGLDPNVPMKDSGVPWLGEIPAHWQVTKIRYEAITVSKGTTPSTVGREMTSEGIRFIKAENIGTDGRVSAAPEFFIDNETDTLLARSRLRPCDVLVVIAGATTGKSAVLQEDLTPANTNQAVCFVRLREPESAAYIRSWLASSFIQEQVWLNAVQAAQPNLSMEDIRGFVCPKPPLAEMARISSEIEQVRQTFGKLTELTQTQIDRLHEYRQALISAAVTGQIDVTDEVAA